MLRSVVIVMMLMLCSLQEVHAGLMHDSELSWVTAESEHFRIHYHDGETTLAKQALAVAESVYNRMTAELDWQPREKTEIVLSDETDSSNGFATPLPSNRINIYVSRPSSVNSLEDHHGWLETVILHEFVHILHLDKALGTPDQMRDVFGRFSLLFPNVFMPPWMHEGLATYYETDKTLGIGRGQSSYFEMMMRLEVESGVKPLRQINQPIVTWPLLTSRYLYGVYFYQFLADTYGADVLPRAVTFYSDHLMPFRINDLYEDVLGKNLSQLWVEYEAYLEKRFQPQIKQLKKELVEGERITHSGDFKRALSLSSDGRIYFVSDHLQQGSQLQVIKDGGEPEKIADLSFGANIDWHESAGLLVAQPDICNNANRFSDLYQIDSHTGVKKRLTTCQRYIFAAWSADGQNIVAVKNHRGQHALHLLGKDGKMKALLWQGEEDETLSGIDWSDDGKSLLTAMWRKGSGWNIEEFELATKRWKRRTDSEQVKSDASYVQGTRDILFSMEDKGVYNAFRMDGKSGEIRQLSYVFGGLFSPLITEDNQLLSIDYHASGFDIYKLKTPVKTLHKEEGLKQRPHKDEPEAVELSNLKPYSPWDTLKPTSWFPSIVMLNQGMELGAFVSGTDVLYRHGYDLFAGYQEISNSPVFSLSYVYDRWDPLLKLQAQQLETPWFNNQGGLVALTRDKRLDAELILPWISEEERWSAHLGLNYQSSDISWLAPGYIAVGSGYIDTLAGVALAYDSRESHARSISLASSGGLWSTLLESGESLGGDFTGSVAMISGRHYMDLSNEHVLAVSVDAGLGSAGSRPFYLGGIKMYNILPSLATSLIQSAPFNQRSFALRGYGEGEAALTGQDMAKVSAEYRFPIARVERGIMAPPIGIDQLFGQLFMDAGRAGHSLSQARTYVGTGAELGADFVFFYTIPVRMQLGYAKGLDSTIGGEQFYFRLGTVF